MKTWGDVEIIVLYGSIGLILSYIFFTYANHLSLRDQTLKSLGFRVNRARLILSILAVLLASIATAIAGMFTFVGLLIPHIGRSDRKSTRLNSSHVAISYAVFCLQKKISDIW